MRTLFAALIAGVGLLASAGAANAQFAYGYRYGTQVYYPPGFGARFNPGFYNGFIPGVNQTVISVTPYWRPLVLNTPVVTTPFGPNFYYSNSYSFRTTPFGFNWAASRFQWVDAGIYAPPVIPYPTYWNPGFGYPLAAAQYVEPVVVTPRGRLYPGFVPTAAPAMSPVSASMTDTTQGGSFTAWGAYLPANGVFLNPFSGAAVR